jgi:hypothetical protein
MDGSKSTNSTEALKFILFSVTQLVSLFGAFAAVVVTTHIVLVVAPSKLVFELGVGLALVFFLLFILSSYSFELHRRDHLPQE